MVDLSADTIALLLRIVILVVCGTCLILLGHRLIQKRHLWNTKTRDYWFAMVAWSFAGFEIAVQGIYEHTPLSARTVLVTIAALATLHGLRQKGGWGADE